MPVLTGDEKAIYQTDDGRVYLDNGLVLRREGNRMAIVGRWDPPEMLGEEPEEEEEEEEPEEVEEPEEEEEAEGKEKPEAKREAEPEGEPRLPEPDDEEGWRELEDEVQRIIEGKPRRASALFRFARAYDYQGKLGERQAALRGRMTDLAADLREGRLTPSQWAYRSQVAIMQHTVAGYTLGVAQARGVAPSRVRLTVAERKGTAAAVAEQFKYFAEFRAKVAAAVKAGEPLTTALDARANLYGGAMRSALNQAVVAAAAERPLRWVRHKEDSCQTCLGMEGKVKTAKEWQAGGVLPASGTICDGNCGCALEPG